MGNDSGDTSKPDDIDSLEFDEVIEQLAEFEEYFTSDELKKDIIDTLHTEFGINKAALKLAFKYVAPYVIKQAKHYSKAACQSLLNKLKKRLNENTRYQSTCRTLLRFLKASSANNKRIPTIKRRLEPLIFKPCKPYKINLIGITFRKTNKALPTYC